MQIVLYGSFYFPTKWKKRVKKKIQLQSNVIFECVGEILNAILELNVPLSS